MKHVKLKIYLLNIGFSLVPGSRHEQVDSGPLLLGHVTADSQSLFEERRHFSLTFNICIHLADAFVQSEHSGTECREWSREPEVCGSDRVQRSVKGRSVLPGLGAEHSRTQHDTSSVELVSPLSSPTSPSSEGGRAVSDPVMECGSTGENKYTK